MTRFRISLDEMDRVMRAHRIETWEQMAATTGVARSTWARTKKTGRPTPAVLDALAQLGASPRKVLVEDPPMSVAA